MTDDKEKKLEDALKKLWDRKPQNPEYQQMYDYAAKLEDFIKIQRAEYLKYMETGHYKLLHCNCIKSPTESQYNRGYYKGWNDAKKLSIDIQKRIIELMKKYGSNRRGKTN